MNRDILQYILFRLPICDNKHISLEEIMEEFDLKYPSAEPTQEELAGYIYNNITNQ